VLLHRVSVRAGRIAEAADGLLQAVVDAARWGHGDARRLLMETGWRLEDVGLSESDESAAAVEEDPEFAPAVRAALAAVHALHAHMTRPVAVEEHGDRRDPFPAGDPTVVDPHTGPLSTSSRAQERGALWSPAPLRPASLTGIAQQVPDGPRSMERWESVQRVLDVLDTISSAGRPISAEQISRATSLPCQVLEQLLFWLCQQGLATSLADRSYMAGPILLMLSGHETRRPDEVLQNALAGLRDAAGAAVYVSSYIEGEVKISRCADGPATPKVNEWVDFRAAAHASAVGKSLLAQLDFEGRMDHLSRRRPVRLTSRTITDQGRLFHALDGHGPEAAQFDLLEYSTNEVCAAVPLSVGGQAGCVALSLPVTQRHRLVEAARILSSRSASLLLSLLLATLPSLPLPVRQRNASPGRGESDLGPRREEPTPAVSARHEGSSAAAPQTPGPSPGLALPRAGLYLPPRISAPTPRTRHLVSSSR
jgi:DNA-binding IclR family transcriptional regulator